MMTKKNVLKLYNAIRFKIIHIYESICLKIWIKMAKRINFNWAKCNNKSWLLKTNLVRILKYILKVVGQKSPQE